MLPQLKWNNFAGVHAIVLKGCTSPNSSTYESTLSLLSQFTPFLDIALMDPSTGSAFAINVMALLPYMVANYEDATPLCIRSAENIAHVKSIFLASEVFNSNRFNKMNFVIVFTGEHGEREKNGKSGHSHDSLQSPNVQQRKFPVDQVCC